MPIPPGNVDKTNAQKSISLVILLGLKLPYMHKSVYSMPSVSLNKSSDTTIRNEAGDNTNITSIYIINICIYINTIYGIAVDIDIKNKIILA